MEKTAPRIVQKGLIKDGVHIIIPNIVTKPALQYYIRDHIMNKVDFLEHELKCKNNIEDIFDKAVIEKNGWMMCGSRKKGIDEEAYKVTKHYTVERKSKSEKFEFKQNKVYPEDSWRYVETLSIRNKFEETPICSEQIEKVQEIINKHQDALDYIQAQKNIIMSSVTNVVNHCEDIEYVKKMVNILDPKRCDSYPEWIRLGWCLRSIDYRLVDKWVEFSRESPKYKEGECERLWRNMKTTGIGIGSLCMWAKNDSPEEFAKLMSQSLYASLMNSISGTDYDIACVIYNKFKSDFVCSSIKNKNWYEYKNHRWNTCENGYVLKNKISVDMFMEYNNLVTEYSKKASNTEDEDDQERYTKKCKKFTNISLKMKKTEFKDKMIKECSSLFFNEEFEDKLLDSNPHLIGFENGVLDLENMEFREGRPEDYISMSTRINYIPIDDTDPLIREQIMDFMRKVVPNDDVREYLMMVMASMLDGNNKEEKFYVWSGKGSNGKSKCIELMDKAMGDYSCTFNVSLLTSKRGGSGQTNSELVRAKGRRFAVLQEPEENEKMNAGFMKELSGNDKIITRGLYKDSVEFKPMFKMILTCNHLPNLPAEDGGTWRRVRLIEFKSKFTDNPNPLNVNEFAIDRELSLKFDDWKETYMSMLVDIYKTYKEAGGITEPKEVMQCTDNYQRQNDNIGEFLKLFTIEKEGSKLFLDDLYNEYKQWYKSESIGGAIPRRKVLETYMDNNLTGTMSKEKNRPYWLGYKLCMSTNGIIDDDDDDDQDEFDELEAKPLF